MEPQKNTRPRYDYFPWWARDWITSPTRMGMTSVQRGVFIDLLSVDWENDGLPEDDATCLGYLGRDASEADLARVLREFKETHPATGRRTHRKANAERERLAANSKTNSANGKKGGRPPKDESEKKPTAFPGESEAKAVVFSTESEGEANGKRNESPKTKTMTKTDVLLEKEPKGADFAAPAVGGGIADFNSPSVGEPFPSDDAENPGSGEAGATATPAGNPVRITTNDAAFADFLAKGPKIERPVPTEAPKPKKAKAAKEDKPAPAMPFASEAFANAWAGFVEMRERNRWKLTPRAIELIFMKLIAWGEDKAIGALQKSTVSSWRDVYEPDERRAPGRNDLSAKPLTAADHEKSVF